MRIFFGANINKREVKTIRKLNPITMQHYDCKVKVKCKKPFKGAAGLAYRPTKGYTKYNTN